MIITLPFSGFYNSIWSDAIDQEESSYAENLAEEDPTLDASAISDALFWSTDYPVAYLAVAKCYAEAFDYLAKDELGFSLGLTFESMLSPREYNFETDRIFCEIPFARVKRLFAISRRDNHGDLRRLIKKRFTSYDGFCSGYTNDAAAWLDKPLADWDHNELGTLLLAVLPEPDTREMYDRVFPSDGAYHEWEPAVDWDEFDRRLAKPDQPEKPYRCHITEDLSHA